MTKDEFAKRTFDFGIRVVRLVESLTKAEASRVLGKQLLRSGTSVGANYRAAKRARSRADFIAKMGIVEEECDESIYWIEMLVALNCISANRTKDLLLEANEILSMTISSIKTARQNAKSK
jgi:four helix bundle protein